MGLKFGHSCDNSNSVWDSFSKKSHSCDRNIGSGYGNISSTTNKKRHKNDPNPQNYKIIEKEIVGDYQILKVRYNDCINYDGIKILVLEKEYRNNNLSPLDPHFLKNNRVIMRFHPEMGLDDIIEMVKIYSYRNEDIIATITE